MELTRSKKLTSFEKAALVAARFGGHNWEVEDVGVVLDVRDTKERERHLTLSRGKPRPSGRGKDSAVSHRARWRDAVCL